MNISHNLQLYICVSNKFVVYICYSVFILSCFKNSSQNLHSIRSYYFSVMHLLFCIHSVVLQEHLSKFGEYAFFISLSVFVSILSRLKNTSLFEMYLQIILSQGGVSQSACLGKLSKLASEQTIK